MHLMLRIIDRYLLRELAWSILAVTAILLLVTVGGMVADLLNKIAHGRVPSELLFALIGLRTVDALTALLPLAMFLGVLLAYGRLYRDSEMAVFAASGVDIVGLMRPLLLLAAPATLLLAVVSFWLAPASVRLAQILMQEASRSLLVAGLEPGRFIDLPGRDGIIYVGGMSDDGTHFTKLFVQSERKDKDGKVNLDITTAETGSLYHDVEGSQRFMEFDNGFRVEGIPGQDDYRLMRYVRNDVKLPDTDADANPDAIKRSAPTAVLFAGDDLIQRAELQRRLSGPLSVLVLMLLALPLAKSSPREPRYTRLVIAILAYLAYSPALTGGRFLITSGKLPPWLGLSWVHILTVLIALYLLRSGQKLRRPRLSAGGQ
jgi:lipopolysaccharide export system permease protein